jgi:multicomponent Na+:H+ antiporter subunit F
MYVTAAIAVLVTMALVLVRALLGPTVYDRILAVNIFGTKTVILMALIAFLSDRPDFLDLALTYALINFIGVLAVLEFFQHRVQSATENSDNSGERQ